jgi:hypothetical protein
MKNSGSRNPIKIKIKSKSTDVPPKPPSIGHLDPIKNRIMKGIRKCVKRSMVDSRIIINNLLYWILV